MTASVYTCKPGGCAATGCEGGHYCFTADGTPKISPREGVSVFDGLDVATDRIEVEVAGWGRLADRARLRDEFAMRAMQGAIAFEGMARKAGFIESECSLAYEYADAMLAAREGAVSDPVGALARDAVKMLEGYAASYDCMARSGDGIVNCRSVAQDIRANMGGWFRAHLGKA